MSYCIDYSIDCLKSNAFIYDGSSSHEPSNVAKQRKEKPEMRPDDELFAFNWYELPEGILDSVRNYIESRYGTRNDKDVRSIFKVLVARDFDVKLAYVKRVRVKSGSGTGYEYLDSVFNEKTFKFEPRKTGCSAATGKEVYYLMKPGVRKGDTYQRVKDKDGYVLMEDSRTYGGSYEKEKCAYDSLDDALRECRMLNDDLLDVYFAANDCKCAYDGSAFAEVRKRVIGLDLTKKHTIRILKSEWMRQPKEFDCRYPEWRYHDNDVLNAIKKYQLSTETETTFLEWVMSGCGVMSNKRRVLTAETAKIVSNRFDWPYMSRGAVVECFHGMDGDDMSSLKTGSVFTAGKAGTRYVVIRRGGHDPDDDALIAAKEGTTIDGFGMVDPDNVMFICDSGLIDDCWDALFDVNRIGKRKKHLKNVKIVS